MINFLNNRVDYMVYIQQAMNSLLEHRKRQSPHYPLVIPIQEEILDNLLEPEFQL